MSEVGVEYYGPMRTEMVNGEECVVQDGKLNGKPIIRSAVPKKWLDECADLVKAEIDLALITEMARAALRKMYPDFTDEEIEAERIRLVEEYEN